MPPKNVKTIKELIHWEYAKLIAGAAVGDRENYAFVMYTFKKLNTGNMKPSTILKENKKLVAKENSCAYCGASEKLQWEHIIPKSRGGHDNIDNMVQACEPCNKSKGARDLFEWYGKDNTKDIPGLVLGKYLKLVFDHHENTGTLDSADLNNDGQLDVYDLGAIFQK